MKAQMQAIAATLSQLLSIIYISVGSGLAFAYHAFAEGSVVLVARFLSSTHATAIPRLLWLTGSPKTARLH
jgi:hypothetical protein